MAKYRAISLNFWTDSKISDDFTPEDRYFYLYLFTNPHTNLCGCYEISIKQMVNETGYSKDTIERLIERFRTIHKVIDYSPETKEVLLINWHKYNWTSSEKFRKPLATEITDIKNNEFRQYLSQTFNGSDERYGIDTPCIDTTVSVSVSVSDNVSVSDINKGPSRKNFVPPTVEEVRAYCLERGNSIDPEAFIDFYESKGWMVGKNKMKDWKAAVRNWERRSEQKGYVPKKNTPKDAKLLEYGRKIYEGDEQRTAPYFGFPPEWFDGERLLEERIVPLICDKAYVQGGREDYEFTIEELKRLYESRKRGKENEQFFNDISYL